MDDRRRAIQRVAKLQALARDQADRPEGDLARETAERLIGAHKITAREQTLAAAGRWTQLDLDAELERLRADLAAKLADYRRRAPELLAATRKAAEAIRAHRPPAAPKASRPAAPRGMGKRNTRRKLTQPYIDRPDLPPEGKRELVWWDTVTPGLGIRVRAREDKATGKRTPAVSYVVRYRRPVQEDGKAADQWKALGAHPGMKLAAARKAAKGILGDVARGVDPVAAERAAKAAKRKAELHTLGAVVEQWLEALPTAKSKRKRPYKPRTIDAYRSMMKLHVVPALGDRPIGEVTQGEVKKLHEALTRDRGPYCANRAVDYLAVLYTWAAKRDLVPWGFDPTTGHKAVEKNDEHPRGAEAALDADAEARLLRAIYAMMNGELILRDRHGKIRRDKDGNPIKHSDPVGAVAMLVALDTGRRAKDEVLNMTWDRLNTETGRYMLAGSKGGQQVDEFTLEQRDLDAIRRLPRYVGNPYIFTGESRKFPGRRGGLTTCWNILRREAGLTDHPNLGARRVHDLRHTRGTGMLHQLGVAHTAKQLGHKDWKMVEQVYGHLTAKHVQERKEKVEYKLVEPAPPAEVVEIASRR